ncbi:hypothetical protein NBM05_02750 [Rothia sp. AR01]|uniref:Uncharacterized protein n=1 Tax=Rothia santali TaxID=2949643 RepID=A0A9X2KKE9_9MICC|nr:hypothetical protein [Rothia santali]MCP3424976.1 hypothetical protein [Rothia santali]
MTPFRTEDRSILQRRSCRWGAPLLAALLLGAAREVLVRVLTGGGTVSMPITLLAATVPVAIIACCAIPPLRPVGLMQEVLTHPAKAFAFTTAACLLYALPGVWGSPDPLEAGITLVLSVGLGAAAAGAVGVSRRRRTRDAARRAGS